MAQYGTIGSDAIVASTGQTFSPASSSATMKNRIINGAMTINQRNATVTTPNGYITDRWYVASGSATCTAQQSSTAPVGFTNSLYYAQGSTTFSPASNQWGAVAQSIEGFNTADLGFGTSNAKTVTISFWVYASLTGTYAFALNNAVGTNMPSAGLPTRSYVTTYTVNNANTWQYVSITIPGDITGTWVGASNAASLTVVFNLGSGSNYTTSTVNAWQTGAYWQTSSTVSLNANASSTFYITGVQLEAGNTASNFDYRHITTELQLCQRYYEQIGNSANPYCQDRFYNNANRIPSTVQYAVAKRTVPSITAYSGNNTAGNFSGYSSSTDNPITSIASPGVYFVGYFLNLTNAITQPHLGYFTASAEL